MGRYARSSFFSFPFRTPLAANTSKLRLFPLGLVPLSDSSLKIQDEAERQLVFTEKFVSISPPLFLITKPYAILAQYKKTRTHQISGVAALNLQRDLWAKFTSKYLHLLVDRILNLPPPASGRGADYPIQNIYHTTLKFTDHAYLARFMRSTHPIAKGAF
jgi:hypothetical protein